MGLFCFDKTGIGQHETSACLTVLCQMLHWTERLRGTFYWGTWAKGYLFNLARLMAASGEEQSTV